jgi:hypothetical protein
MTWGTTVRLIVVVVIEPGVSSAWLHESCSDLNEM